MPATFFLTPAAFRAWLEENHQRHNELLVGFYKKGSGTPSISWQESVDAALCYGWIDGVRRRIDDESYSIRFTPRRPRSIWSAVNIERAHELALQQLMQPAGLEAFEARTAARSAIYSFEQANIAFEPREERQFRAHKAAWKFFQAQTPWYRRAATWWVISAKRQETKAKRLASLIADSAANHTLRHLTRQPRESGEAPNST